MVDSDSFKPIKTSLAFLRAAAHPPPQQSPRAHAHAEQDARNVNGDGKCHTEGILVNKALGRGQGDAPPELTLEGTSIQMRLDQKQCSMQGTGLQAELESLGVGGGGGMWLRFLLVCPCRWHQHWPGPTAPPSGRGPGTPEGAGGGAEWARGGATQRCLGVGVLEQRRCRGLMAVRRVHRCLAAALSSAGSCFRKIQCPP